MCRNRREIDVVAINDIAEPRAQAHLLRYDSVRGPLDADVAVDDGAIIVDHHSIASFRRPQAGDVPWGDLGVDVVLEATGRFFSADQARRHLDAGAGRVVVSTATVDPDVTILMGVNEADFDPARHRIISPACCTSSAAAPIIAALRQSLGLRGGMLTTVHAFDPTKSSLHDAPHWDLRMGRAATVNLIPARLKPGSIHALSSTFPELAGRIAGLHVRVPAIIGCVADLDLQVDRRTTAKEVNAALAAAAEGSLKGYLGYTEEEIVSSDIIGRTESCIVDAEFTTVVGNTVKVIGWYDNEWGFANRLADVIGLVGGHPTPGERPHALAVPAGP
ncbi:glyceraldehyde-3-phosphate dehydrogenase [Rugosimonospora africana]|uniref:Glyceraldehyde-3-phosphate dehydrogenase n=1 Tax=Rugosimonospora africana TaxID=556532 RepID=A0A8J3QUH6_9ACTN|nr:glyceraldehyde-3-phosphate dehydrogenase [Rugosimonospora africana]